jgi:putative hemolysin
MSSTIEILIILLLIIADAVFVISEMAIVSAREVRLQQMASRGDSKARVALQLANAPNQFLSTVQIGITVLAIVSGAFSKSTLAKRLTPLLELIPWLRPYNEAIAAILAIGIIAYLTLVIGELVPKRLALNNPEAIAAIVAIPMRLLSRIAAPLLLS